MRRVKVCPACAFENAVERGSLFFCQQCGAVLFMSAGVRAKVAPVVPVPPPALLCPDCDQFNNGYARACLHCGCPLPPAPTLRPALCFPWGEELVTKRLCIGRQPHYSPLAAKLTSGYDNISARHAEVWLEDGELWLEDAGSSNGTFLNDKQLIEETRVPLKHGDIIRFAGDLRVRVKLEKIASSEGN